MGGIEAREAADAVIALKTSKAFAEIRRDLIRQLELKEAATATFLSLVDDYLSLWVTKELLRMDIEARGTCTVYNNGGNQTGTRRNDSVGDLVKVNAQMSKLLSELDIRSTNIISDGDHAL